MVKPDVDELLWASKRHVEPSVTSGAALDALVTETRYEAARGGARSARRLVWAIPASLLAVGALTGGGVLFAQYMDPDVRLPVEYVTASGTQVGCTLAVREYDDDAATREWLASDVWDGFGQRVYDHAIAHPWVPEGTETQDRIDAVSFDMAMNVVIDELLTTAPTADAHLAAVDNCSGQLR